AVRRLVAPSLHPDRVKVWQQGRLAMCSRNGAINRRHWAPLSVALGCSIKRAAANSASMLIGGRVNFDTAGTRRGSATDNNWPDTQSRQAIGLGNTPVAMVARTSRYNPSISVSTC